MNVIYRTLIVLGFWRVPDGDFYRNGRWQWAFWRAVDIAGPWSPPVFLRWPFVYDIPRLARYQTVPQTDTMPS